MSENSAVEASAVAISQKVTATSGVSSFVGFATKIDVIAWGGLIIAAIGLIIQLYFAVQKNRRRGVVAVGALRLYRQRHLVAIHRLGAGHKRCARSGNCWNGDPRVRRLP